MKLNSTTARRAEGRSARPDAPAARGREGRRRDITQRQASSLRTRAEGQGGGPARTLPASTAALPPGSPRHPSARGVRARLPAQRWLCRLGAADSRTDNYLKNNNNNKKKLETDASRAPQLRISLTPFSPLGLANWHLPFPLLRSPPPQETQLRKLESPPILPPNLLRLVPSFPRPTSGFPSECTLRRESLKKRFRLQRKDAADANSGLGSSES